MVVDTSAVLAVALNEADADWVTDQLKTHRANLIMSTVNLAEAMMILQKRIPSAASTYDAALLRLGFRFIPPTVDHARRAADARHRFPLNLGDCFVYALSVTESCPILTLDEDFRGCDRPVLMPST